MSDETTLLPCPFCGGEARLVNDYSIEKGMRYQIWHECTGHEGRSGGYGQGVKPFFETPWYPTDAEAIAAWNTRAHGTLTAEQVREAIERNITFYEGGDYDEQAIADELNALLGSGTCEIDYFDDGLDEALDGEIISYAPPTWYLTCGHTVQGMEAPSFCQECGKRVIEAVER